MNNKSDNTCYTIIDWSLLIYWLETNLPSHLIRRFVRNISGRLLVGAYYGGVKCKFTYFELILQKGLYEFTFDTTNLPYILVFYCMDVSISSIKIVYHSRAFVKNLCISQLFGCTTAHWTFIAKGKFSLFAVKLVLLYWCRHHWYLPFSVLYALKFESFCQIVISFEQDTVLVQFNPVISSFVWR